MPGAAPYVPAAQNAQAVQPAAAIVPGAQMVGDVLGEVQNEPGGHREHDDDPEKLNEPRVVHARQAEAATLLFLAL